MSYHNEMHKKAQAEIEAERKKMHERNLKHMEAMDKMQPTPTIAEIQEAMGVKQSKVEEPKAETPKVDEPSKVEEKTSEPAPAEQKGGYQTRASNAKK